MNVGQRVETEEEKIKRLPTVLRAYAKEVEQKELIDCDFPVILERAAAFIEASQ